MTRLPLRYEPFARTDRHPPARRHPRPRRPQPEPPSGHRPTYHDCGPWPYGNPGGLLDRAWRATCECGWVDTCTWPAGALAEGDTPVEAMWAWYGHLRRTA